MIIGIGTDICDIRRISTNIEKYGDSFINKILSEKEILQLNTKNTISFTAGRFAAKEALQKAISSQIINFNKVTILNDENGKPFVDFDSYLQNIISKKSKFKIHISISHEKDYATALCIIEKK